MKEDKIKAIHNSHLFGNIIECGCGACVSTALYEVEGASKTIYCSLQPYNKQIQSTLYEGIEKYRSVSYEFVNEILEHEVDRLTDWNDTASFVFASSFQLQGEGQTNLTHGWIGFVEFDMDGMLAYREFYHLSIPTYHSRKEYFEMISDVGINLLYSKIDKNFVFTSPYIDNFVSLPGIVGLNYQNKGKDAITLLQILNNISANEENFIVFEGHVLSQYDRIIRFEDFCRDKPGIILVKGSFNPLHERHMELMETSVDLYSNYNPAFHISIGNRDKEDVDISDLFSRIKKINSYGYDVIVSKQARFNDNLSWIRQRWKLPIIFPVGVDTINRFADDIMESCKELEKSRDFHGWDFTSNQLLEMACQKEIWQDAKFLVFDRKGIELNENTKHFSDIIQLETEHKDDLGISSTKIRNGEFNSKL
jgi:hypothetical protein